MPNDTSATLWRSTLTVATKAASKIVSSATTQRTTMSTTPRWPLLLCISSPGHTKYRSRPNPLSRHPVHTHQFWHSAFGQLVYPVLFNKIAQLHTKLSAQLKVLCILQLCLHIQRRIIGYVPDPQACAPPGLIGQLNAVQLIVYSKGQRSSITDAVSRSSHRWQRLFQLEKIS